MDTRLPRVARFPVEEGHIQLFARAIGDPNPIYFDNGHAQASALQGIIAPPTFSEAGNHFDEGWPFRPRWGRPELEPGATPTGAERLGIDRGTAMHAETHFVYHRLVRPGMVLSVSARSGRQWTKRGARAGRLEFGETISKYYDQEGELVLECMTVVLQTERKVSSDSSEGARSVEVERALSPDKTYPRRPLRRSHTRIGDATREVLVRNLSRAHIVQYAGVSGDFSPQHIDEVYNTRVAGYPSVFAHGMLTMGMAGRVVTDFVGDGRLQKFGFQFRRQVWPGDSLLATVRVIGFDDGCRAKLEIEVTNQHDQLIGSGYSEAAMDVD